MDGDNADSARDESESFPDEPVEYSWDFEGRFGRLFAKVLNLKGVAWDVHLLYAPGVTWDVEEPLKPTFWMHQLPPATGADGEFF